MVHNVLATALALTGYFIEYQLRNKYSIPLEAEFRDFNGKGGISLPELLIDFNAGIFLLFGRRPELEILCNFGQKWCFVHSLLLYSRI